MAGTLKGGQQRQLAIARALISKPQLLLLDELTEGIQPSIVLEIGQLLQLDFQYLEFAVFYRPKVAI